MEINSSANAPMPAMPEPTREPPRDAVAPTAVREPQAAAPESSDTRFSRADGDRDASRESSPGDSSLGNYVDETV